jgi:hypothetical protein
MRGIISTKDRTVLYCIKPKDTTEYTVTAIRPRENVAKFYTHDLINPKVFDFVLPLEFMEIDE